MPPVPAVVDGAPAAAADASVVELLAGAEGAALVVAPTAPAEAEPDAPVELTPEPAAEPAVVPAVVPAVPAPALPPPVVARADTLPVDEPWDPVPLPEPVREGDDVEDPEAAAFEDERVGDGWAATTSPQPAEG